MFQTRIPPPVYALFMAALMGLFNHYTPSFRWIGTGVYRISRNPMYLGMVLSLSGWAWLLGSPLSLLMVLAFARILSVVQIESYLEYSRQVNRWIGCKSRQ